MGAEAVLRAKSSPPAINTNHSTAAAAAEAAAAAAVAAAAEAAAEVISRDSVVVSIAGGTGRVNKINGRGSISTDMEI